MKNLDTAEQEKVNSTAESNGSIRVFKSDFWEALTHVHPILPLVIWGPVSLALIFHGHISQSLSVSQTLITLLVALVVWTFMEYFFHRFAFHFPAKGPFGKRIVFLFHGLHHDAPNDKTRLVFPPFPAFLLLCGFYGFYSLIVPGEYLHVFMGGFMVGYLCYDYIHYATHHFPMKSKVGKYLRSYHLIHHFSEPNAKYGVSSPLWDYIFGSVGKRKVK
ncbi:MAG: sterol desaturase family protein [Bacteriovoracaceae bacterium]